MFTIECVRVAQVIGNKRYGTQTQQMTLDTDTVFVNVHTNTVHE